MERLGSGHVDGIMALKSHLVSISIQKKKVYGKIGMKMESRFIKHSMKMEGLSTCLIA